MASEISAEDLKKKLDQKDDFHLVDVLSKESFSSQHVPGAVNVPFTGDNFIEDLKEVTGANEDSEIIVYCSSETCQTSPQAAAKLEEEGFNRVGHFKGGLAGWQDAGFELDQGS